MEHALVYAEQAAGRPTTASLELVSGAADLATTVTVVVAGPLSDGAAELLGDHGASRVVAVDVGPDTLTAPAVAAVIAGLLAAGDPSGGAAGALLLPGTCDGRDIAATVSVLADRPVLANVVALGYEDGALLSEHAVFGGTTRVTTRFADAGPGIYLTRPGTFSPRPGRGGVPHVDRAAAQDHTGTGARVVERRVEALEGPSLEDAPIVVTGGRGLGSAERFASIVELARLLGGAPGATRAIVDAGWAPYGLQVGQTGKTVKPDVYLAFGVSGATQHLVGMRNARHVIAVNTDEHAPILALADLAVVGDAPAILGRLVDALNARR